MFSGIIITLLVIYIFFLLTFPVPQDENVNHVRIEVNQLHNEIERILEHEQIIDSFPESLFAYAVFDIHGRNLGSTILKYQDDMDVRLLSTIKEYTAPLIVDRTQVGTLVVDYQPQLRLNTSFLYIFPIIVLFAAMLVLLISHLRFIQNDIIHPINELHDAIGRMVNGDLSAPVAYDYDGEMGEFCHDFELMRDELRDATERERLHKEKERLLFASLSHDLKTPLSSISGYAESIKYGVVKEPADIQHHVDTILKKTKVLTDSVEDILAHIQTQMHEMSIKKEELYSAPLFEKFLADAAYDAQTKGLSLDIIGEIPNVLIAVDQMRIKQVIENIIGNALKYTAKGGRITVSIRKKASSLHFIIEDTGCGIKPEDVPLVFEPFFRGEKSRDPNVSGSGLGLSITKYIVEQHGGKIACESNLGEGTRLEFSIPVL